VEAFVAAGEKLVCDVMSRVRPFREGRATEEFGVIGMREDNEDVLRGVPSVSFHVSVVG